MWEAKYSDLKLPPVIYHDAGAIRPHGREICFYFDKQISQHSCNSWVTFLALERKCPCLNSPGLTWGLNESLVAPSDNNKWYGGAKSEGEEK